MLHLRMWEILKFFGFLGAIEEPSFRVFWNTPSENCPKHGIDLQLEKYGIEANENQSWNGSVVNILYSHVIGTWPYFDANGNSVNGGLPQLGDLDRHLDSVARVVTEMIPNKEFNGIAILDWEQWDPLWERNWDSRQIYRDQSLLLAKKMYPNATEDEQLNYSHRDFNEAAKEFMLETLKTCKKLRPAGQWGYYRFPDCHNQFNGDMNCDGKAVNWDDETDWLWYESTAIFPSSYIPLSQKNSPNITAYTFSRTGEAIRVRDKFTLSSPVYHYQRVQYAMEAEFLTKEDLEHAFFGIKDRGGDGIVLWNSNLEEFQLKTGPTCEAMKNYIETTLGPLVLELKSLK